MHCDTIGIRLHRTAEHVPNLASQDARRIRQHRSNTGSRSPGERADDLQHVGGGGLLLQRFAQLVEQPRVLDGDDGLSGEVLYQLDLLVRIWPAPPVV